MFAGFIMFLAFFLIASAILRLGQTYLADTPFGAALAWFHS